MSDRLTAKQELWVSYYMVHNNASRATLEAGYSKNPDSARVIGARMLAKVNISEAISRRRQLVIERLNVTADMVVSELVAIGFAELSDVAPWDGTGATLIPSDELERRKRAAVKGMKFRRTRTVAKEEGEDDVIVEHVEFVMHDKVGALKLLAQHLGIDGLAKGPKKVELHQHNETTFNNLGAKFEQMDVEELLRAAEGVGPGEPAE